MNFFSKGSFWRRLLIVWVLIALTALPVPYLSMKPGPVFNTLGNLGQEEFLQVSGSQTYPTTGRLDMTTVREVGGPETPITLFEAVSGWINPDVAVVPRRAFYQQEVSEVEVEEQSLRAFASSQDIALAAALRHLKLPFSEKVIVVDVIKGMPAAEFLKADDQILEVSGLPVDSVGAAIKAVRANAPGSEVIINYLRNGKQAQARIVAVKTDGLPGQGSIGAYLTSEVDSVIKAKFADQNVGGPSAGLVFTLAIIDVLTPGDLTGNSHIGVTGTITTTGEVGGIGGVKQKMIGARKAGATVFLAPGENCDEIGQLTPKGLKVVPVSSIDQAVRVLKQLNLDSQAVVPTCTAK